MLCNLKTHSCYPEIHIDDGELTWVARLIEVDGTVCEEKSGEVVGEFTSLLELRAAGTQLALAALEPLVDQYQHRVGGG